MILVHDIWLVFTILEQFMLNLGNGQLYQSCELYRWCNG